MMLICSKATEILGRYNSRPDSDYQKWKWKPTGCTLPRFDALRFLGRMRRKRIMLMGDSMMRNQWESLVCLVQGIIPIGRKMVTYNGPAMAFHAMVLDLCKEVEALRHEPLCHKAPRLPSPCDSMSPGHAATVPSPRRDSNLVTL
ncbi:Protein trichome birefringence-like 36 [Vigna angularis]|uniref:Protein trichome birefringence-like 36 n=1 Tax=Phaseolus angularis TaxID=3914 RepID=A0A8T0K0X9_PHAAN|nr:Protein trichome birefringence-like 36 [Vigna angularis]